MIFFLSPEITNLDMDARQLHEALSECQKHAETTLGCC